MHIIGLGYDDKRRVIMGYRPLGQHSVYGLEHRETTVLNNRSLERHICIQNSYILKPIRFIELVMSILVHPSVIFNVAVHLFSTLCHTLSLCVYLCIFHSLFLTLHFLSLFLLSLPTCLCFSFKLFFCQRRVSDLIDDPIELFWLVSNISVVFFRCEYLLLPSYRY